LKRQRGKIEGRVRLGNIALMGIYNRQEERKRKKDRKKSDAKKEPGCLDIKTRGGRKYVKR